MVQIFVILIIHYMCFEGVTMNNMDDTEVVVISDDEVVVLPAGAEDEEEHLDLNQIVIDNVS